jgi:hypothetical protein
VNIQGGTDPREQLADLATVLLASGTRTETELDAALAQLRPAFPHLEDADVEVAKRILTERLRVEMDMGVAITASTYEPWLDDRFGDIEWRHWRVYKQLLLSQRWSPTVLDTMDQLTHRLLDFAGDPESPGTWSRRGLAIGDVQSGKTATYLALFNKAVDSGYRLIIVLAGGTEVLRQQTQERVDEGLIGRDSRVRRVRSKSAITPSRHIGIGELDASLADATGMTTVSQDFRKTSYEATSIQISPNSPSAYVFVVKKNKSVLDRLAQWLDDQPKTNGKIALPVLLLDDESDYASVNTREETDPTAINAGIRTLLQRFSRSSYLAVTATPFANIFIDHDHEDDLFPRDYVYALDSPTNYSGSKATFGTIDETNDSSVEGIDDAHDWLELGHKSSATVETLPDSLLEAIEAFFVANAIRDLRGDSGPRSMLVNVSRFKAVQRQVYELVAEEAQALRNALDLHAALYASGAPHRTIDRLRAAFEGHYGSVELTWEEVLAALPNAAARIDVQLHNSDRDLVMATQEQVWDAPPRLIAIGGDVLSRGLTLGGLTVSYFHRRVGAYDTLMQMARWFGYREGYADLCRIWIDSSVVAQYRFIQDAIDELKSDLEDMHRQKLTPKEFGLAVKKHPGALLVTARNKMKATTDSPKEISLAGRRIESTRLSTDEAVIDGNLRSFSRLAERLSSLRLAEDGRHPNSWNEVPKAIVAEFLDGFTAGDSEALFLPGALSRFVRGNRAERLQSWDVVIVNGSQSKRQVLVDGVPAIAYYPPERNIEVDRGEFRIAGRSSRLGGVDDIARLVRVADAIEVRQAYQDRLGEDAAKSGPGEIAYYPCLPRPALLVYPLQPSGTDEAVDGRRSATQILGGRPLVAVKIAIPSSGVNDSSADAVYVINKVAQQKWFPEYRDEDDENAVD